MRQVLGADADASVGDLEDHPLAGVTEPHHDPALEGELEGVGQEVEDDLLPHLTIEPHGLGDRRALDDEVQPRSLDGRTERAAQVGGQRGDVHRLVDGVGTPGLDPREIEQRVDELEEPHAVALRRQQLLALGGRQIRRAEHVFERPQHERERGPELVAHVAEELRLGPIERGQRVGPLALLHVSVGVGQDRRDLTGQDVVEAAIGVVEPPPRAHRGDEHTDDGLARHQRERQRSVRRIGPRAARQPLQSAEVVDDDGSRRCHHLTDGPPRIVADERERGRALDPSAGGDEPGVAAIVLDQVEQRERHVRIVGGERLGRELRGFLRRLGRHGQRAEVAQRPQSPLAEHALGRLGHRDEVAEHVGALASDRAVGEREVGLFQVAVALHQELEVGGPGRIAGRHHVAVERPADVPDLGPALVAALAHRTRMLRSEEGPVTIVVKLHDLRAPPDRHRETRGQTDAETRAQALRPGVDRTER